MPKQSTCHQNVSENSDLLNVSPETTDSGMSYSGNFVTAYLRGHYDNKDFLTAFCDGIIGTRCESHIKDKTICDSHSGKHEPQAILWLIY